MLFYSLYNILPLKKQNKIVLLFKLNDPDYRKFNPTSLSKLFFMLIDVITHCYEPMSLIYIFDAENMRFMHITRLSLAVLRAYTHYLQECLPLRLEAIHVLNATYVMDKIFCLVKPMFSSHLLGIVSS